MKDLFGDSSLHLKWRYMAEVRFQGNEIVFWRHPRCSMGAEARTAQNDAWIIDQDFKVTYNLALQR